MRWLLRLRWGPCCLLNDPSLVALSENPKKVKNHIRYEYDLDHIDCEKNEITFNRHINHSDGSKRKVQYIVGIEEIGKTESNIRNALEKNEVRLQLDDPQWKSRK